MSLAPKHTWNDRSGAGQQARHPAVGIDCPRSQWRIGGGPLAGHSQRTSRPLQRRAAVAGAACDPRSVLRSHGASTEDWQACRTARARWRAARIWAGGVDGGSHHTGLPLQLLLLAPRVTSETVGSHGSRARACRLPFPSKLRPREAAWCGGAASCIPLAVVTRMRNRGLRASRRAPSCRAPGTSAGPRRITLRMQMQRRTEAWCWVDALQLCDPRAGALQRRAPLRAPLAGSAPAGSPDRGLRSNTGPRSSNGRWCSCRRAGCFPTRPGPRRSNRSARQM